MVVVKTPSEGKPSIGKSIRKLSTVTRVGLDLAKRVLQVHAVDAKGEIVLARKLTRSQLIPFLAELPPCVEEFHQVGREYFARAPRSDIWVEFGDLPDETRERLWNRHNANLMFPSGLEGDGALSEPPEDDGDISF